MDTTKILNDALAYNLRLKSKHQPVQSQAAAKGIITGYAGGKKMDYKGIIKTPVKPGTVFNNEVQTKPGIVPASNKFAPGVPITEIKPYTDAEKPKNFGGWIAGIGIVVAGIIVLRLLK